MDMSLTTFYRFFLIFGLFFLNNETTYENREECGLKKYTLKLKILNITKYKMINIIFNTSKYFLLKLGLTRMMADEEHEIYNVHHFL